MTKLPGNLTTRVAMVALGFVIMAAIGLASPGKSNREHSNSSQSKLNEHPRDILPIEQVLNDIRPHIKGEIIEIEFDYEDGIPVYEFKYISSSGRVLELYVDARSGRIIKEESD